MKNLRSKRGQLKRKLDVLFSEMVRARGACVRCGKRETLQCAHVVSRTYLNTRWDLMNAMCLCAGCHLWWHHNPIEAGRWFDDKHGRGEYDKLRAKARLTEKVDLEEIYEGLVHL